MNKEQAIEKTMKEHVKAQDEGYGLITAVSSEEIGGILAKVTNGQIFGMNPIWRSLSVIIEKCETLSEENANKLDEISMSIMRNCDDPEIQKLFDLLDALNPSNMLKDAIEEFEKGKDGVGKLTDKEIEELRNES